MDRDTARARIQFHLGNRSSHADKIVLAMQDAQIELEQQAELPWFLLEEVSSASTVVDEERVAVPSDFLRETEEDALYIFDSTLDADKQWTLLIKEDLTFLRKTYPGTGTPGFYALVGAYYRLFPTPDAVKTLKHIYYKTDAVLTTNVENQWLKYFPNLIIGRAGMDVASDIGAEKKIPVFAHILARAEDLYMRSTEDREHTNRRYVMGGAD